MIIETPQEYTKVIYEYFGRAFQAFDALDSICKQKLLKKNKENLAKRCYFGKTP